MTEPTEEAPEREPTETVLPPRPDGGRPATGPEAAKALPPAGRIGRYVVLSHLGTGGMGTVYAAYDPDLDRKVALKLVRHDRTSIDGQNALLREARALARLAHPNVVRIYDVGLYEESVFFAMELVSGRHLGRWLERDKPRWKAVVGVFREVADGLAAAHRAGLVHRDLKPGNILLGEDGRARIADFGLVRSVTGPKRRESPPSENTRHDAGTPGFVAPEVVAGGEADELSDQYSFGIALRQALHGRPRRLPSETATRAGNLASRRIPARLAAIVERTLNPAPGGRFRSMSEVSAELGALARRPTRRWAVAGLLALGVAAASPWLVPRIAEEPPCVDSEEAFSGVWDPDRRQSLERALLGSGSPVAEEALEVVTESLDRYRNEWLGIRHEGCLATRVRGVQSERLLDLRMLCLEQRRQEARALVDLLLTGNPSVIASASEATQSLSATADCANDAELALFSQPPGDPAVRREIERLEAQLARQVVRSRTGQAVDLDELRALEADAEDLGYYPLQARARMLLGRRLVSETGDPSGTDRLERALADAIAAGDRALTAELYGRLAEAFGYYLGDSERAHWWVRFAEASLDSLGPDQHETYALVLASLGLTAYGAGDTAQAHEHWRQALVRGEKAWGSDSPRLVEILNNIGFSSPNPEEQLTFLQRALDLKERTLGPQNPLLANTLVNLASRLGTAGRFQEALPLLARASAVLETSYSREHPMLAYPLILEGELLIAQDRPTQAVERLERARELLVDLEEGHPLRLPVEVDLARSALLDLRIGQAEEHLERAGELLAGQSPASPHRLLFTAARGRLLLQRGEFTAAYAELERATELEAQALEPPAVSHRAQLRIARGEVLLALGRPAAAEPLFEQAIELTGANTELSGLSAGARFGLARAIVARDRDRAVVLARRAADDLPPRGSAASRRLAEDLASWLRAWQPEEKVPE
ncbi:MAG: protein kinase [Acidobacteriota bacterium]